MSANEEPPRDEFASYTPEAKVGILHIRSLPDADLLDAARDMDSPAFNRIFIFMGPSTNPSWIAAICAQTAYERGVMAAEEMDWLLR